MPRAATRSRACPTASSSWRSTKTGCLFLYAWDEQPRPLTVTGRSRAKVELHVIPLNTMSGRVYIDRNGNGRFDENEGVPGAVISVNESVTATDVTGTYDFYNQPPGRYIMRLDVPRLAKGLAPASAAALDVELTDSQPFGGVDFIVDHARHADHHAASSPSEPPRPVGATWGANCSAVRPRMGNNERPAGGAGNGDDCGAVVRELFGHRCNQQDDRRTEPLDDRLFECESDDRQGASCKRPGGGGGVHAAGRRRVFRGSKVSWTLLGANGGTATSGTLSSSLYGLVFQSNPGDRIGPCRSGVVARRAGSGVRAGNHHLVIRWKVESITP